jgi:phosphatidylserine synthase
MAARDADAMKTETWTENAILMALAVFAVLVAVWMDKAGMPHKWHTAIFATLVPFGTVILLRRRSWPRLTFWVSLWILLAAHLFLICLVFGIVLREFNVIGLLWWCPIAFIETLILLGWEQQVERRLRLRTKS